MNRGLAEGFIKSPLLEEGETLRQVRKSIRAENTRIETGQTIDEDLVQRESKTAELVRGLYFDIEIKPLQVIIPSWLMVRCESNYAVIF